MKFSTAIIIFTTATSQVSADDWSYGSGGVFHECSVDGSGYSEFITGLCGSGDHGKCGTKSNKQNGWQCNEYPGSDITSDSCDQPSTSLESTGNDGWICYDKQEDRQLACPAGTAMAGFCSSSSEASCKQYCDNKTLPFAIKCEAAPSCMEPVKYMDSKDGWVDPSKQDNGGNLSCPAGQVVCGACFGDDSTDDCNGVSHTIRCCDTGAFKVTGSWVPQFGISTQESRCVTVGVDKSEKSSYSETDTWSQSVSNTASVAYSADGATASDSVTLSASESKTLETDYVSTWSVNVTVQECHDFSQDDIGLYLFQWITTVVDNSDDGNAVNSATYSCGSNDYALMPNVYTPPQCLPGGYLNSTNTGGDYTSCAEGYYLPGYGDNSGRMLGSLRGSRGN